MGQQGVREQERMCKSNSLKCLCLNARSMKKHSLELEAVIMSGGYDTVGITETRLGDEYNRGE